MNLPIDPQRTQRIYSWYQAFGLDPYTMSSEEKLKVLRTQFLSPVTVASGGNELEARERVLLERFLDQIRVIQA